MFKKLRSLFSKEKPKKEEIIPLDDNKNQEVIKAVEPLLPPVTPASTVSESNTESKSPETIPSEIKSPEIKSPEIKPSETVNPALNEEPFKSETVKPALNQEPFKSEANTEIIKKASSEQISPKQAPPKQAPPKQASSEKSSPEKSSPEKVEPAKVEPAKAVEIEKSVKEFHPDDGQIKPGEQLGGRATSFEEELKDKGSWLKYLKNRLVKTRHTLKMRLEELIGEYSKIDDDFLEGLEEILISSDLGVKTTQLILDHFEEIARIENITDAEQLMELIKEVLLVILDDEPSPLNIEPGRLNIILTIGVNGVGKTTTIGKMAARFMAGGKKVMLAAGDTFRAGAVEQLEVWGRRTSCEVIKYNQGGDAAAVVYEAIKAAKARNVDVLLVDTAGRLHNKFNLMEELAKIKRIISREIEGAPHETILVIDANTGQNGVAQAKVFKGQTDVTGIVLTKIDGTAKGGVTVAIKEELRIPVKLIGIGEQINDLRIFKPKEFVSALLGE